MTFIENMKNFYFLLNQIEDLESNGGQVIIKNEISSESLIPTVEINIKNEIIYPNEENHHQQHHQVIMGSVIQQHHPEPAPPEPKRKKRKNNKRKSVNGQTTMEIDETGNLVARQIVTAQEHHQQQVQTHQSNLHISQHNDNEMALMLTVKQGDGHHDHAQQHTITVGNHQHTIQPIQIHSSELKVFRHCSTTNFALVLDHPLPSLSSTVHHTSQSPPTTSHISIQSAPQTITTTILPQIQYSCSSCNEIFANTDTLRQHLFHSHQILFPPFTPSTEQYQVQLPQTSLAQTTTTIQPVTQQYTFTHPHKKYFDSEFPCLLCGVVSKNQDDLIKHMIRHTSQAGTSSSSNQSTIVERERVIDVSSTPTDLSNSQYK